MMCQVIFLYEKNNNNENKVQSLFNKNKRHHIYPKKKKKRTTYEHIKSTRDQPQNVKVTYYTH